MSQLDACQGEARQRAREYLQTQLQDLSPEKSRRMAVSFWGASAGWQSVGDNTFQPSGEYAEQLAEAAKSDPAAWDAATTLAAWLLEQGDIVPPVLAMFAAGVLRGLTPRPGGNRDGFKNLSRDLPLCMAVSMLLEAGFTGVSNSGTTPYVFDAVAELAGELGENVGVDMLVKIWRRHGPHVEKVRREGPIYFYEQPGNFPLTSPPARAGRKKATAKK